MNLRVCASAFQKCSDREQAGKGNCSQCADGACFAIALPADGFVRNRGGMDKSFSRQPTGLGRSGLSFRGQFFRSFNLNGSDETISPARDCFDIQGFPSVVAEGLAQFLYRRVQTVVYFHRGLPWPHLFLQFLPGDQLPRTLYQEPQDADRLGLDVETNSMLVDFAGFEIDPKGAKRTNGMGIRPIRHPDPGPPPM